MEQKYQAFQNFNFQSNADWNSYFENLYPKPTYKMVRKFKKKWYKQKIDPDFDLAYQPGSQQQNAPNNGAANQGQQQQQQHQQQNNYQHQQGPQNAAQASLYQFFQVNNSAQGIPLSITSHVTALLLLAYIVSFIIQRPISIFIIIGVMLDSLRKYGRPRCQKQYFARVVLDDDIQSLSLVLFTSMVNNLVFMVPIFIFIAQMQLLYIWKLLSTSQSMARKVPQSLRDKINSFVLRRSEFRTHRAEIEIYIGLYLFIGIIIGTAGLFSILFYWQFLRMLYMVNGYSREAFRRFGAMLDRLANHQRCPGLVKMLIGKVRSFAGYLSNMEQGQGGAGSTCNIF